MRTIHREIVGAFILSNDDHILLGTSGAGGVYQGHMIVPGGGVHNGESLLDAVIREVQEELNLNISNENIELFNDSEHGESEKVLPETGERVSVKMHFNDFVIHINKPASAIAYQAGDDLASARWVPLVELPRLKLGTPMQNNLRKLGYL